MRKDKLFRRAGIILVLIMLPALAVRADGGYFSKKASRSVAVSEDQRAIIIRNGSETSMALSTGYTGKGDGFCWIIPTPVRPSRC